MQKTLVKGVISGGSMSVLSREVIKNNNCGAVVMSSEESSSYPDDSELELGLGLSLGCGVKAKTKGVCDQYAARILTAKDFCSSVVCDKASSSSSSSSASVTKANTVTNINGSCGTKRTAEPSSPPGRSQVVGWPPVRTYRMNSLANQAKSPPITEDFFSTFDKSENKNIVLDMNDYGGNRTKNMTNEKGFPKKSLFIKVNMDGTPIGRKVDIDAHTCYKSLARALDDMFGAKRSSEFVLTYEDKDGDWMLVGDVPWEMFLNSVRRLRIMRKAEANGLAPKIS